MSEKFEIVEASMNTDGPQKMFIEVDRRVFNRCPEKQYFGKKGGKLLFIGRLGPGTAIEVVCPSCSKRMNDTVTHRFAGL